MRHTLIGRPVHDPQLERAVEVALKQLAEKPVRRLMKEPPPPEWGKRK